MRVDISVRKMFRVFKEEIESVCQRERNKAHRDRERNKAIETEREILGERTRNKERNKETETEEDRDRKRHKEIE